MRLRCMAQVGAVLLVGAAVWLAGLFAVGRYTEDICFGDLDDRTAYGSYHQAVRLWPPSIQCELAGPGVEPLTVDHRIEAGAAAFWLVVAPIGIAGGAVAAQHRCGRYGSTSG